MIDKIICEMDRKLKELNIHFKTKPLIFGGLAKEYYGIRKKGLDIDLIVTDEDYQNVAKQFPNCRFDMWGDLGVAVDNFEILRSVCRYDYDFYVKEAIDIGDYLMISIDRLFYMCVTAMEEEKYKNDYILIRKYYDEKFRNSKYVKNAQPHIEQYIRSEQGKIYKGKYENI